MKYPDDFEDIFGEALGTLAIMLDYDITAAKIEGYYKYFTRKGYAPAAIIEAIAAATGICESFPKPAKLLEIMTGGKGGGQDPVSAWQQVLRNLETHGVYKSVEFEDGAIAAAIEMLGGWPDLGAMSYEEMTLQRIQARFESLYREAVRQGRHLRSGRVAGLHEIGNGANYPQLGIPRAQPALTGAQIMNAAASARPAMKLPEAPPEPVEIPADLHGKANNLAARMRLN